MDRKRLSSIVEESEPKDSGYTSRSSSERRELLPKNLAAAEKSSSYALVEPRGRRRSSSLGRFFRMALCGSRRTPQRNFSNTPLEIPPFRGEPRAVITERELSSQERLVRASGQLAGILVADIMRMESNPDSETAYSGTRQGFEEADSYSRHERAPRPTYISPSTGAIRKTRARSVPPRLEECENCENLCEYGGIVVDKTLFPQTDFRTLISQLPSPLFKKGTCPACCSECRAVAAGVPVNESTRTCCCGFEKAKCLLPDVPIHSPPTCRKDGESFGECRKL